MAGLAQGRECFGSRCGGQTGLAAGVCGDQKLRRGSWAGKKERNPTCGGDRTKLRCHRSDGERLMLSVKGQSERKRASSCGPACPPARTILRATRRLRLLCRAW